MEISNYYYAQPHQDHETIGCLTADYRRQSERPALVCESQAPGPGRRQAQGLILLESVPLDQPHPLSSRGHRQGLAVWREGEGVEVAVQEISARQGGAAPPEVPQQHSPAGISPVQPPAVRWSS